jgi:hypothetical protein
MCNSAIILAPRIAVTNAATGAPLCGATITQFDDDASAPVPDQVEDAGSACAYELGLSVGAHELAVSMPGFATADVTMSVQVIPCGESVPAQATVQVKLVPI